MKNAAIICGGYSSEFDISVKSAVNIFNNFPENYTPYLVEITKKGWKVRIKNQLIDFNSETFVFLLDGKEVKIDFSIIYIHGDPGENGKLQSYLDMIDMAFEPKKNSRLSCQLIVSDELNGLTVTTPEKQS